MPNYTLGAADFHEQGKLGALLLEVGGEAWRREAEAAKIAGQPAVAGEDELLAADDFYFSTAELMNCCLFARQNGDIVGAAGVNPFTATLHFLAVKSAYRRRGLGKSLLAAAEQTARRYGHPALKLEFPVAPEFAGAAEFFAASGYALFSRRQHYGKALKHN
ncbi:hypothetical protein FACS1894107_10000 [Planctomycetales bacterium]|nr:hypothetical protein FACS1894107_10000 [Planctomycetales bacterium]GHS96870.1 hypothetical protein FACS1894108_02270 [Planctomycetales bacterium]